MGTASDRIQELPMKSASISALFFFVVFEIVCWAAEPNAIRDKIAHDSSIQGYPCARGYAWFYPDGSLNECTVSRPVLFGNVHVPRGSVIQLWPNGAARYLNMPHAGLIAGYRVTSSSLSESEGNRTTFYPSGKLRSIFTRNDKTIDGVPCRGVGNTLVESPGGANRVEFYEDGKLQSCQLIRDYQGQKAGQRLTLPDEPVPLMAGR
jgi:hypothetical protein